MGQRIYIEMREGMGQPDLYRNEGRYGSTGSTTFDYP